MLQLKTCGENVKIYPLAKILGTENITIGSNVIIDDFVFIGQHQELVLGNYVHLASHVSITGGGRCLIADFAGLSSGTRIITGSDDFMGAGLTGPTIPSNYRAVRRDQVLISAYAVLGANCVVLPGVTVGEGATVGAGSIVTCDLSPWTVYVGTPARPIKDRERSNILAAEQDLYKTVGKPLQNYRELKIT